MRKNVFAAALILALGVGSFAACSSDDVVTPQPGTETLGGTTFMAVKFSIPQGNAKRSQEYNFIDAWSGRDDVQSYKAYIFDSAAGTLEAVQVLTPTDFSTAVVGSNYVITPSKAIRVKPGNKVVYVVVNPNPTTDALLPATLATTTLAQFKAAYEGKDLATAGQGVFTSAVTPGTFETSTKNVAKTTGAGLATKDVIVMTGEPAGVATTFTVNDGVSESDAAAGVDNQAAVNVKRAVARVVVTSRLASYTLQGDDPYTSGVVETTHPIGEVKALHFVTAQSERQLYFQQGEATGGITTATTAKYNSPAIAQDATDDYGDHTKPQPAAILKQYDYTNLWKNRTATNVLGGNEVHQATPAGTTWTAQEIGQMSDDCDFILPTTHEFVAIAPGANYKYRKGNTAYVLIRAAFVPKEIQVGADYMTPNPNIAAAMTAGNLAGYVTAMTAALPSGVTIDAAGNISGSVAKVAFSTLAGHEPDELVYGVGTHKFYSSEFASQDPVFQGVKGQPIQKFTKVVDASNNFLGYKMLYFAWVNPDNVTTGWYNSPVYRNNIYHVEIDNVGGLGENWNPLVPATPTNNNDDPHHPNNPDPFVPNGPVTLPVPPTTGAVPPTPVTPPVTPVTPIKPSDPLTQKKTHMSVKVTVLPWQVHSYKLILQN